MNIQRLLLLSCATGALIGVGQSALAQDQEQRGGTVGEVVITAEKRSESIQDVPVAVTAFTSEMREETGITTAQQQLNFTPGVNYASAADRVTIRGVGRVTNYTGTDPGVAVYADGFYVPSVVGIGGSTLRSERVEVLRGPQGTLYGRNSIGGAINNISRRPSDEFEGELRTTFNDYEGHLVEGRVSGPLAGDWLRGSFSASLGGQEEGYFHNLCAGSVTPSNCRSFSEGGVYESWDAEVQLAWNVGTFYDGWLRYLKLESESSPRSSVNVSPYGNGRLDSTVNPTFGLDPNSNPLINDHRGFTTDRQSITNLTPYGLFITEHVFHFDSFDVKYVGGLEYYDSETVVDGDATARTDFQYPAFCVTQAAVEAAIDPLGFFYGTSFNQLVFFGGVGADCDSATAGYQVFSNITARNDLIVPILYYPDRYSHELNFTSTHDGPLQWLGGLYYYHEDASSAAGYKQLGQEETQFIYNFPDPTNPIPNPEGDLYYFQTNLVVESWAAYGQIDYDFTDTLHGTFGLRYSHDNKQGYETYNVPFWLPLRVALTGGGTGDLSDFGLEAQSLQMFYACTAGADGTLVNPPLACPAERSLEDSWQATTGVAGLQWTPNDDTLVYGRYSRGYKSGGYNLGLLSSDPSVDEETIDAYELGWKQTLGSFQFNTAVFFYQYHDLQVNRAEYPVPGVVINTLINLPETESKGLELETIWAPTANFRLLANYTYLDTEIVDAPLFSNTADPFANRPGASPSGVFVENPPGCIPGNTTPGVGCIQLQDITGSALPGSPEHKVGVNGTYTWFFDPGELSASLTVNWRDSSYYTVFNTPDFFVPEATITDLNIMWNSADDRFSLIGRVTNLFDVEAATGYETLEPTRNFYATLHLEPPRVMSVQAQYRF